VCCEQASPVSPCFCQDRQWAEYGDVLCPLAHPLATGFVVKLRSVAKPSSDTGARVNIRGVTVFTVSKRRD
jgi:hypothetical protein